MRTYYYVDIPDENADGSWRNVATFDTKEEALAYCKDAYGADDKGRISLISWTDQDEDDDDASA